MFDVCFLSGPTDYRLPTTDNERRMTVPPMARWQMFFFHFRATETLARRQSDFKNSHVMLKKPKQNNSMFDVHVTLCFLFSVHSVSCLRLP